LHPQCSSTDSPSERDAPHEAHTLTAFNFVRGMISRGTHSDSLEHSERDAPHEAHTTCHEVSFWKARGGARVARTTFSTCQNLIACRLPLQLIAAHSTLPMIHRPTHRTRDNLQLPHYWIKVKQTSTRPPYIQQTT